MKAVTKPCVTCLKMREKMRLALTFRLQRKQKALPKVTDTHVVGVVSKEQK